MFVAQSERAVDVLSPGRWVQASLWWRRVLADEQGGDGRQGADAAKLLAQQGGLIVASAEQPGPVQGHGGYKVRVLEDVRPGPGHPAGEGGGGFNPVGIFEGKDEGPGCVVIGQHGAGALENRGPGDTGSAQVFFRPPGVGIVKFERQATGGAVGLADKRYLLPAVDTERAILFDQGSAAQALGRHQYIQRF